MPPLNAACPWAGCSQVYANLLRASRSLQRVRGRAWRMLTHSTKQDTNVRANCPNVWPLKLNVPHRLQALSDPMQFHTRPTSHGSIRSLKWKNRLAMLLNHVKQLLIDSSLLIYPLQDPSADNTTGICAKFWMMFLRSYINSVTASKTWSYSLCMQYMYTQKAGYVSIQI